MEHTGEVPLVIPPLLGTSDLAPAPGAYRPRPPGAAAEEAERYMENTRRATIMTAQVGEYEIEVVPELEHTRTVQKEGKGEIVFEGEDEEHHDVVMFIRRKDRHNGPAPSFAIKLTRMTEYELYCLRDVFNAVVELVLPTAMKLDEKARNRDNSDGKSNRRLYRGVSAIHTNEKAPTVYIPGLYDKSQEPPVLEWPRGIGPRRPGVSHDAVAELGNDPEEPSDDSPVEE